MIENNHYFPPDSIKREFLRENDHRLTFPWKGEAHYYDIFVESAESRNPAWSYPHPKDAAKDIRRYVAFWKQLQVSD